MCKFQLFSKSSPLPLFGWVDYTCGKGKRARDTVFISTVVLFRLINAEFHKKIGSFGAGGSSWCVSERKAAGRIFIGVKSLIFPSGCQSNPATADSETPAALQPLSYSYSTPPSFTIRDLFPYHNREQANNLCFFVMDSINFVHCIFVQDSYLKSFLTSQPDKLNTCQQFPCAESQS